MEGNTKGGEGGELEGGGGSERVGGGVLGRRKNERKER